jgi:hypothetical protein
VPTSAGGTGGVLEPMASSILDVALAATTLLGAEALAKGVSRVELYDISGKLVFTENIQKDIVSISTAQLKNGVYFAKAYTLNSEQVSLKKVIVSK